ncbi:hypothetical protein QRB17_000093 [Escherichia coli]|nr:hypothetical protein [Escherichia coli]
MSLTNPNELKISLRIAKQRKLVDELRDVFPEQSIICKFYNFIDYVDNHRSVTYYHLNRIRQASCSENDQEVYDVVSYFCGGSANFLDLIYCYYGNDDTDPEPISSESYYEALTSGNPPVSLNTGKEIDDFDVRNISFFCILDWAKE